MSPLRVSTRRVPKADKVKLAQKAMDRLCRNAGRRLPENQAVAKGEDEREGGEAGEEDVAEALSPVRWTSLTMSLLFLVLVCFMDVSEGDY